MGMSVQEKGTQRVEKLDEFYVQALMMAKVVERTLWLEGKIKLSEKPELEVVNIVEFMRRMRVWSLDKFPEETTYVSTINFYIDENDMEKHRAIGALIIYIGEDYIFRLFRKLGYPKFDEDDEEALEDACGTFANIIGAKFKTGLTQLGYIDLAMSHCSNYRNEIINGVEYDIRQDKKYEISFEIDGEKRIVAELTLGKTPKN